MRSAMLTKNSWKSLLVIFNRWYYPYDYARFKKIKQQVEINNEKLKIHKEIELYGHPLLTGITVA